MNKKEQIKALNDKLRKNIFNPDAYGMVVVTPNVDKLPLYQQFFLMRQVMIFSDFNYANDPQDEHDFGNIEFAGNLYYFKIDYYDKTLRFASPDPSDSSVTTRLLTIMRADEY